VFSHLYVIFTFWCHDHKEADFVGFAKHNDARIIVKVLLSVYVVVKLGSIVTAIQHQLTARQIQLVTQTQTSSETEATDGPISHHQKGHLVYTRD